MNCAARCGIPSSPARSSSAAHDDRRPADVGPRMRTLHLARVVLHLLQGLATCALVFPLAGPALRERCIRNWSGKLLAICGVRLSVSGVLSDTPALIVCNHV